MGCARRAGSSSTFQVQRSKFNVPSSTFQVQGSKLRTPSPLPLSHPMDEGDRSGTCVTRPSNFLRNEPIPAFATFATSREIWPPLRNRRITEPWLPSFASVQLRVQPERRLINVNQG